MDKFFVVLPSDSSMKIFPENKISNYTTAIPNEIKVDPSKWEVALQEIQFPHTWFNIRKGHNKIFKRYYDLHEKEREAIVEIDPDNMIFDENYDNSRLARVIEIPSGNYEIESLIDKLNEKERGDPRPLLYKFNQVSGKVSIRIENQCGIAMANSDIARCLGFAQNFDRQTEVEFVDVEADITIPKNTIGSVYVYSDIIENQYVGDYKAPLLRVIPVRTKFNEVNWVHYDKPHFLRLSRENINTIEINIRDETGEFVSFESGKVIITLVFRRISSRFYQ